MYKLLVADDEDLDRKLVRLMLEGNTQFEIIGEAKDGLAAVSQAKELEPDLILMDIRMPNKNGLDAAKEIKSLSQAKIIFLTAHDDFEYAKEAIRGKASAYLLKPIDQDELLKTLTQAARELEAETQQEQRLAQLKYELETNLDVIRTRFFNDLLEGSLSETIHDHFKERLSLLNLALIPNTVVVFKLADLSKQVKAPYIMYELSRHEIWNDLVNNLKKFFANNLLLSDSCGSNYRVAAGPITGETRHNELLRLLSALQEELQAKYALSFSAGIGGVCPSVLEIAKSYEEAMIALSSFDSGEDTIICYEDLGEKGNAISYPSYLEQQLLLAIRSGNLEKSLKLSGRFLSFFVDKVELDMGKMLASEIILKATRLLTTSGIKKSNKVEEQLTMTRELMEIANWVQLTAWLRKQIQQLVGTVISVRGTRKYIIIEKAQRFLEEHFAEELTLDKAANYLGISPCYFSTIFKEVTGTSFSDQLMHLRMEKAKELLKDPNFVVSEVGYKVGFNDPAYFSRAFKRIVGFSPTFYRGSNLNSSLNACEKNR